MKTNNSGNKNFLSTGCPDLNINVVTFNEDLCSPWHYHEKSYFTFIQKGGNVEKRKNGSLECAAGMLLFYNSDDLHCNDTGQAKSSNFNVEIEDIWFQKHGIDRGSMPGLQTLTDPQLKSAFLQLMAEALQPDLYSKLAIEGHMLEIFSRLLRSRVKQTPGEPAWVKKVRDYLLCADIAGITLNKLAIIANLHPVTLSKEFPLYFKEGFAQYIRNMRLQKAIQLLGKKSLSVEEIADKTGFSDASHLISVFKKKFKLTPAEYRSFL